MSVGQAERARDHILVGSRVTQTGGDAQGAAQCTGGWCGVGGGHALTAEAGRNRVGTRSRVDAGQTETGRGLARRDGDGGGAGSIGDGGRTGLSVGQAERARDHILVGSCVTQTGGDAQGATQCTGGWCGVGGGHALTAEAGRNRVGTRSRVDPGQAEASCGLARRDGDGGGAGSIGDGGRTGLRIGQAERARDHILVGSRVTQTGGDAQGAAQCTGGWCGVGGGHALTAEAGRNCVGTRPRVQSRQAEAGCGLARRDGDGGGAGSIGDGGRTGLRIGQAERARDHILVGSRVTQTGGDAQGATQCTGGWCGVGGGHALTAEAGRNRVGARSRVDRGRLKLAEVWPAVMAMVVVLVPSVMVAVPACALVRLSVPETTYWLVAVLHRPGVTLRALPSVQEAGAV